MVLSSLRHLSFGKNTAGRMGRNGQTVTDVHVVGCTGKVRFTGFRQAARAAKRLRQKDNGAHVEPYACKWCHGCHVGESRSYGKKSAKKEEQA